MDILNGNSIFTHLKKERDGNIKIKLVGLNLIHIHGKTVSDISEILDISLLSNKDTMNLIRKPVEGYLDYQDETVQRIYQLSGGYPFYVQYLCHTLVSEINLHIRRDYAVPEDMDRVIQHIIRNPVGHIQETWKSVPWEAKSALAALAHTQKALDEYTEPSDVFKTIKELWENIEKEVLAK